MSALSRYYLNNFQDGVRQDAIVVVGGRYSVGRGNPSSLQLSGPNPFSVFAIRDIIPPPVKEKFNDICIAYQLMDTDLQQIIRSNQGLLEEQCQVLVNWSFHELHTPILGYGFLLF